MPQNPTRFKPGNPIGKETRFQGGNALGPPCKLTPEAHALSVKLAREGRKITIIADRLRVRRRTFYDWIEQGEADEESKFGLWLTDFREARAKRLCDVIDIIEASDKGHAGLQWSTEKQHPEEFGRLVKTEVSGSLEHSGPNGGAISIEVAAVDLAALVEARARRDAVGGADGDTPPAPTGPAKEPR